MIYNNHIAIFYNNSYIENGYVPEIYIQKWKRRIIKEKPSDTKTAEQIKEESRLRKKKQRDELKEKLGHAKYKEIRSRRNVSK